MGGLPKLVILKGEKSLCYHCAVDSKQTRIYNGFLRNGQGLEDSCDNSILKET